MEAAPLNHGDGEGTEGEAGYERLFGGESFIKNYSRDFSDHPKILITRTNSVSAQKSTSGTQRSDRAGYVH
ncbi:protein of unknown function [Paraburkholderia kururiensis]